MDAVRSAIDSAARSASSQATREVRANALSSGWDADVARSLRVSYSGNTWTVESTDERAEDLEYGNGESLPTAAVRQFVNRPENLEKALLKAVETRLKGVL